MMNPWDILKVHRQSTEEEVRNSFLAIARKHHPDKTGKPDMKGVFAKASEAYRLLSDRRRLGVFMQQMIIQQKECKKCKGHGCTYKQKGLIGRTATRCEECGGAGCLIGRFKNG